MKAKIMFSKFNAYAVVLGTAITIEAQDTPILVSSIPANNAQNVPINTAISFTFNEAMFPGYSVDWSYQVPSRANYWSKDQKTIIYLLSVPLPQNALITWDLNPSDYSPSFRNLAGTYLPSGLYQGSFTTGTNAAQLQITPVGWSAPNQFHLKVIGAAGKQVVIYGSTNLTSWIPLVTNNPCNDPIDFTNLLSPLPSHQFYKASLISTPQ